MATRPVFVPSSEAPFVSEVPVDFTWYSGFAISQKQKSIDSLHLGAAERGMAPLLEVSSKSVEALGVALSAFNLEVDIEAGRVSVESAFQGSKVFGDDANVRDLYLRPPLEAKRDPRLRESGPLSSFELDGVVWPLEPKTAFYDWLYCSSLWQHANLAEAALEYSGFTDIEFNPKRSFSSQARSVALFVALSRESLLPAALESRDSFLSTVLDGEQADVQERLF